MSLASFKTNPDGTCPEGTNFAPCGTNQYTCTSQPGYKNALEACMAKNTVSASCGGNAQACPQTQTAVVETKTEVDPNTGVKTVQTTTVEKNVSGQTVVKRETQVVVPPTQTAPESEARGVLGWIFLVIFGILALINFIAALVLFYRLVRDIIRSNKSGGKKLGDSLLLIFLYPVFLLREYVR